MLTRRSLLCTVVLTLSGPVLAQCTGDWTSPTAETMSISDGTVFRITRFANREMRVSVTRPAQSFDMLFTLSGMLVKGIPEEELERFARDAFWWTLFSAPASGVVWKVVRADPCKANGTHDIDVDATGGSQHPDFNLLHARGQAVADGQGLIRYAIRFDTEPARPPDRLLTYTGTMSFVKQGDALPGDIDVGGFNVMPRDGKPAFVAASGTTLAQLRAQLAK